MSVGGCTRLLRLPRWYTAVTDVRTSMIRTDSNETETREGSFPFLQKSDFRKPEVLHPKDTLCSRSTESVRVVFVLGGASYSGPYLGYIRRENWRHGDLVVLDFVDSYRNLTIKMAAALSWVIRHCEGAQHVLKVDEDTFVHVPQLIALIKKAEKMTDKFVLGHQHLRKLPEVLRYGRWKVSWEYHLPFYPRYLIGHSYVISRLAVRAVFDMYRKVPTLPNEDAFFTGILAKLSNTTRLQQSRFAVYRRVTPCEMAKGYFISATNCCEGHLRYLYQAIAQRICDKTPISRLPFYGCRFYRHVISKAAREDREARKKCDDFIFFK